MWKPYAPCKPYNAACSDCGIAAEVAGGMRRGLCSKHYNSRRWHGTLPPREPYPPIKHRATQAKRDPEPGCDRYSLARRDRRRQIAAARLARVGLPLNVEPGTMPLPQMSNNSRDWAINGYGKLT